MTEPGYLKAQSDNLPKVDPIMVAEFLSKSDVFSVAEIRGVKANRAGHESYGDSAVGYVQIKREGSLCKIKGRICPEHKVRNKTYNVTMEINEYDQQILSIMCHDCAASAGGCKHAIAFLMWVHRRSEEPAPTEITCYWKKSKLAGVGTSIKFLKVEDFGKIKNPLPNQATSGVFLQDVVEKGLALSNSSQLLKYFQVENMPLSRLGIHQLLYNFAISGGQDVKEFLTFAKDILTATLCEAACKATVSQSSNKLWHELRYGRITASRIYEVSRCKTSNGSLVETIVGSLKIKETEAMTRGKVLEKKVLQVLQNETEIKCSQVGLLIKRTPILRCITRRDFGRVCGGDQVPYK